MSINYKKTTIIGEIYSKCLKQENDISGEINKMLNGFYPVNTIDRINTKIVEKLENFSNSILLLSKSIDNDITSTNEKEIWRRKRDNMKISYTNLSRRLENCISTLRKKNFDFSNNSNGKYFGENISTLDQEGQTWKNSLRMSKEIESMAVDVSGELDNQAFSLSNINNKITNIFQKVTTSNYYTNFMIRRGRGDTWLCLFLGVLTLIIMYICYYYLRPKVRKILIK